MVWNQVVSKVLGYFSIGCWLVVFAPQIYENYKRKGGDGVSLLFLYIWILGDIIHYYNYANRRRAQTLDSGGRRMCITATAHATRATSMMSLNSSKGHATSRSALTMPAMFPIIAIILSLVSGTVSLSKPVKIHPFSQAMGYISAVLFLGARIPQIIKNYRKKSCEGLSIGMFIFSILGNVSFTMSLMLYSLNSDYILANIPWILGSTGTLFFDLAIFLQFYWYHGSIEPCESTYASDAEV
ncbi:hypothetical protein DL89DRAFT_319956 [Linderina pennispora]|uniref:PQ-loop-domain-containing protein n=1 Tax=Linderina pennispora TaxID=61395 RepID=A0A1Y1WLH7_9FUNG|nr:uncharacterized protein DL89DRAFT_319956 [Linderina pennispora]ORX74421.1 hypothetical protein DL89DRAFT_319956 [Linderina pennispora]